MIPGVIAGGRVRSVAPPSGNRYAVTVPAQAADMDGFPVYVDLSLFPAGFWSALAYGDGRDIRVKDAGGVDVPFDLVHCSRTVSKGELFVRQNLRAASAAVFYVHLGNPADSAKVAVTAPNGRNAVWAGYTRVFTPGFSMEDRAGIGADAVLPSDYPAVQLTTISPELSAHQGVTWDGTHYYAVDTNAIRKYDAAWNLIAQNLNPVGDVGGGTNHCGDPEIVGGVLYIPVENYVSQTVYSAMHMARFNASDLSFISATDISAQNHEVSSFGHNPADGLIYCTSYNDSAKVFKYTTAGVYVGTQALGVTIVERLQGITFWRGFMWLSSYSNNGSYRGVWRCNLNGTGMLRIVLGSAGLPGSIVEGLSSKDDEGLLLLSDSPAAYLTLITHSEIKVGYSSQNTSPRPAALIGAPITQWTLATTAATREASAVTRAAVSFGETASTTGARRATVGRNGTTGYIGLWNSVESWLMDTTTPAIVDKKIRVHATHDGVASRSLYIDGALSNSAAPVSARPAGTSTTLFFGARDISASEIWVGTIGFTYLRAGVLPSPWIAAESANLASPASFYSVAAA